MEDFTVTQNGKPLNENQYTWNKSTKTFSSTENNLVLDFSDVGNCTFNTGYSCIFKTGVDCTFDTGFNCAFKTGDDCTFKTGVDCAFDTGRRCTFDTGRRCTFNTDCNCAFNTGVDCVVVRRDVFEVIELEENVKIKLNDCRIKGYTVIEDVKYIEIDGKKIEISLESYEKLKESLV